ncbi:MAG: peptidase MA family metallohydrolase [Nitrospira sp.]|nr:peptidase MA family metallohydrolase [Nitrospira sp.]
MYRRNISHLLYKVALIVVLIILYGAWFKPTYLQRPPSQTPDIQKAEANPSPETRPPAEPVEPPPKQTRLIDHSVVPRTKHQDILAAIRDDLEKGDFAAAASKLENLSSSTTNDPGVRPYVAVLWNNVGIEQEKTGGTKESVQTFKRAASLDPKNPVIQLNLAHAYWELRDPAMTMEFLDKLISLAPDEPFPHLAMAELLQERDRLKEAARHLDQATQRAAKDPAVQSYLRTVAAKVRKTDHAEEQLSSRESAHFIVKFDGQADQATWTTVQDILEEAYREIGQRLGHFPSKPVVVVLQTEAAFQGATGSPVWADGLFDPVLGRIQIPSQGALTDRVWLTRVLRHEFAHAVLHDLQGRSGSAIPTWLNEGLAMQLAGEQWSEIQPVKHQEVALIPLTALEGGWGNLPTETASVAYLEASSAVHYMIDRYGLHGVNQLLAHLKARQTLSAAMQSQLSLSYEQFQSRWAERFKGELAKG